ncbi:MAG: helix-turn-helix transcriptional regulator [Candidatus ainarchaeum sp.]|nr:helix-turn-helix transcriptional regulator [Candidatus ainarchaeum sp.]
MKNKFDISNFINTTTEQSVTANLVERERQRRKELKLSRLDLSKRSGVSYSSIRRFESTGDISLASLIKIASTMDCLKDFNELFKNKIITNLKDYK